MQTGYRFRMYPTKAQAQTLLRWIGCQRFIYNAKVSEDRYFRTFARKSLQLTGEHSPVDQKYAQFIGEGTEWLREVPSHVLRNGSVGWMQAYGRYFKKLAARPKKQKKTGPQSVWLTSELFSFVEKTDKETGEISYSLNVGTKKFPVGIIEYKAHRSHSVPASVRIVVESGRWYLSLINDDGKNIPTDAETAEWLSGFGLQELSDRAIGVDRGVAIPFALSNGSTFGLSEVQIGRIKKKQVAAKRWQRKLSRRQNGSANRRKAAKRIESLRHYEKCVRKDFAHQTSRRIVSDPKALLIVFEALGVERMTRRAKPKMDENGKWVRNGAAAKSGLNKSILSSAWSITKECCVYKARKARKLVVEVPAHHTSQACFKCGHTHPDNRLSQAEFVCQSCGHSENADLNAAKNIRQRGVELIASGAFSEKSKKRTMRMRKKDKKLGADCSDVMPVEVEVSRGTGNGCALWPEKQEGCAAMPAEAPTLTCVAG